MWKVMKFSEMSWKVIEFPVSHELEYTYMLQEISVIRDLM